MQKKHLLFYLMLPHFINFTIFYVFLCQLRTNAAGSGEIKQELFDELWRTDESSAFKSSDKVHSNERTENIFVKKELQNENFVIKKEAEAFVKDEPFDDEKMIDVKRPGIKQEKLSFGENFLSSDQILNGNSEETQNNSQTSDENSEIDADEQKESSELDGHSSEDDFVTSSSASSAESLKQQIKNKKKMEQNDRRKFLISEFYKMKEQIINSKSNQTSKQIENAVARRLGTKRGTVYKWKRKLGIATPIPPTYSQKQKRKIVDNFTKLKSKIRSKFPTFSYKETENAASKKFNVCANTINRWKKKIDPSAVLENKHYSATHKIELMRKYHEIKKSDPNSKEADIAVQLKIPSRTLSTWKKELDLVRKNSYSNKEKMELIQKFEEMKGKQSQSSSKLSEQIAKDLGVSYFTICHWKRQLGLERRLTYTKSDKIKLMEKYFKIKRRHPELSDVKISKRLNIRNSNMWKWRQQFVNKNANAESSANDELPKEKQLERKSYSENEKMELMRKYYQIIKSDPKRNHVDIAEQLNINLNTLRGWKVKQIGKQNFLDESVGIMDSSPCQTMPTGIAWEWNRCTKGRKQRKCRRSVLN